MDVLYFIFLLLTGRSASISLVPDVKETEKTKYMQVCTYAIMFLAFISLSKRMLHKNEL